MTSSHTSTPISHQLKVMLTFTLQGRGCFGWLVGFYGISTLVIHLTPNSINTYIHTYIFNQRFQNEYLGSVKYSLADNMGQGKNLTVPSQSDAPEESDLWTAWQLFPLDDDQTCYSKDGGSCIFRWPVMGRDRVGVEACPYLRVGVWW